MYQMASSEVSLHVALAIAGVFGYVFVQWADLSLDRLFCPTRVRASTKAKTVDEVKQAPTSPKMRKPRKNIGAQSSPVEITLESQEAPPSHSDIPPARSSPPIEKEANELHTDSAAVSERVARLLAKKAERKARRAQECLGNPECTTVSASQSPGKVFEEHVSVLSASEASLARWPVVDEVAEFSALAGGGSSVQGDHSTLEQQSHAVSVVDEVAEFSTVAGVENHGLVAQMRSDDILCHDVSLAELSTGDEALMRQEGLEETEEEFSGEDMDCDVHDLDMPTVEESPCHLQCPPIASNGKPAVWTCDEEFKGLFFPCDHDFDDAWTAPLDDVIRSREQAEQVYAQVFESMCIGAHAPLVPEMQYQPVLCDGKQFYTDGENLFMLACIDFPEDVDSVPRPMRSVVDAYDPLHAEFLGNLQKGLLERPASHGPQGFGLPDEGIWNSPWGFEG